MKKFGSTYNNISDFCTRFYLISYQNQEACSRCSIPSSIDNNWRFTKVFNKSSRVIFHIWYSSSDSFNIYIFEKIKEEAYYCCASWLKGIFPIICLSFFIRVYGVRCQIDVKILSKKPSKSTVKKIVKKESFWQMPCYAH